MATGFWNEGKKNTSDKIYGKDVRIEFSELNQYGRIVG